MGNQHQEGHAGMHLKVRGSLHPVSVRMVRVKSDHSGEHSQEMKNHHLLLSINTDTMEFNITHVDILLKQVKNIMFLLFKNKTPVRIIFTSGGRLWWAIYSQILFSWSPASGKCFLKGGLTRPWIFSASFREVQVVDIPRKEELIEEWWEATHLGICSAYCVLLPGVINKKCGHRTPLKSIPLQLMPHFKAQNSVTLVLMVELTLNVNVYFKHIFG